jgi:hypothetical protein
VGADHSSQSADSMPLVWPSQGAPALVVGDYVDTLNLPLREIVTWENTMNPRAAARAGSPSKSTSMAARAQTKASTPSLGKGHVG